MATVRRGDYTSLVSGNRMRILVLFLVSVSTTYAQEAEVRNGFKELIRSRDQVLKRYAMLATGEHQRIQDEEPPDSRPIYFIRLADNRSKFRYVANGHVTQVSRVPEGQ